MRLDVHERDVTPALCGICGGCCRVTFKLRDTTPRYRRFLRRIGYDVIPGPAQGADDCCPDRHPVRIDAGWCRFLELGSADGHPTYRCAIHEAPDYPELCSQFNCVSWAKANEAYNEKNKLLVRAQQAWDRLREGRQARPPS